MPLFERRETEFSPCRKYRYRLRQIWGNGPLLLWILCNPSTADEVANDPTVERCERRTRSYGYSGIEVVNIFAYRAADPNDMLAQEDPVGVDNDMHILAATKTAGRVVCGWGTPGSHMGRGAFVMEMLLRNGIKPFCLRMNADGSPAHPLYIGYDVLPTEIGGTS